MQQSLRQGSVKCQHDTHGRRYLAYIELYGCYTLIDASNDFLSDTVKHYFLSRQCKYQDQSHSRNRVNVVLVQTIAELADPCGDLDAR